MVKVSVRAIFGGVEATGVEEALEALRARWKEDETVRSIVIKAAKEGYALVDTKDMPPHYIAALEVALRRLRARLEEEKPSTLVVKVQGRQGKEEQKKPKTWIWESPEGVRYEVQLHDLTPREDRYWSYRDTRVEEALKWVKEFIGSATLEESPSPWEEALEHEDNPHFRRDLISDALQDKLRVLGWQGSLKELPALVDSLPAREKEFVEAIRSISALVDREEVFAVKTPQGIEVKGNLTQARMRAVLAWNLLLSALEEEDWSTSRVRQYARAIQPFVSLDFEAKLDTVAALRQAKYLLSELSEGRRRVLVYRDLATGEPVLRSPVIG